MTASAWWAGTDTGGDGPHDTDAEAAHALGPRFGIVLDTTPLEFSDLAPARKHEPAAPAPARRAQLKLEVE